MRVLLLIAFQLSLALKAQHINVLISASNNPNEPCIYISPTHPDTIIAASNLRNYYLSYDAGYTWEEFTLSSSFGVWGDPVLIADTFGDFYFLHLSNPPSGNWIDRIVCQKTTDNGQTWNNGSFMGLNGSKAQDKQWVIVDKNNNNIYCTWTEFDDYGSTSNTCFSRILFSKSTDLGDTWSNPIKINQTDGNCIDEDLTTEGAVPAVGPNGEIFVSWAGPDGLVFDKSLDQGNTWLSNDIFVDGFTNGWDISIPGLGRANGLPITKCDLSGGQYNGTIYINWADQSNGQDNTDIWLSKSTDLGNTWSSPIRVNQDSSDRHQFHTWMDIDQSTGYLYFVYYDRRAYSDNQTDVYMAYSTDGGNSFLEQKISNEPFIPSPGIFFGDYNNIVAQDFVIRPIWTRLNNGDLSVYTAIIDTALLDFTNGLVDSFLPTDTIVYSDTLLSNDTLYITDVLLVNGDTTIVFDTIFLSLDQTNHFVVQANSFPNPVEEVSYFSFKLHQETDVELFIIDALGKEVCRIVDKRLAYGKHIFSLKPKEKNISKGVYFSLLKMDGMLVKKTKLIIQ